MHDWFASSADDNPPVRVFKFGGTSVGEAEPLQNAAGILQDAVVDCQPVVVVSAAAGVTDDLVRAAADSRGDRATANAWVRDIGRHYRTLAQDVLGDAPACTQYETVLKAELSELRRALQTARSIDGAARDAVLASGERLMAPLFAAVLNTEGCPAQPVDATALLRTDDTHGDATVQWTETKTRIQEWFAEFSTDPSSLVVPVITGFIGSTTDGTTTTIGRGGSDLSAAVIARAMDAERLERWTDVEGLYTRDPATHPDAQQLDELDFEQARTWTKAGRLGMHPSTLDPLASADIPVHVRCTYHPDAPGTRIIPAVPAR
ncbi:MAG: aspartate kinase [Bacteroidetes bacterium SW_9_63_38]|nr:MAG: aspartate kinase [Bacteroidetes bacterium SW_9_63_38]